MRNICIIPARGRSKRIPRKNIKTFLGQPIISYSIQAAIESQLFDEVMVSTDDSEIAQLAQKHGAKVPFLRSNETSNDDATTYQVLEEVLDKFTKTGRIFEYVCCLYPCAPFVTSEKLTLSYETMISNDFDGVVPLVAFSFPIQRTFRIDNQKISFFYPDYALTRSQDLEKAYYDAGQFYWSKVKSLLEHKSLITVNTGSIVLSELEVQDIDSETDWVLAEIKYKLLLDEKI